jgi:hypothetical protein
METYLLNVIRPTRLVAPIMKRPARRRDRQHLVGVGLRADRDVHRPSRGLSRRPRGVSPRSSATRMRPSNIRMNNVLRAWGLIDSLPAKDERRRQRAAPALRHERGDRRDDRLPRPPTTRAYTHRPRICAWTAA